MEKRMKEKFSAQRTGVSLSLTLLKALASDSLCLDVSQSPSLLWKTQGQDKSAEMQCEHTDGSYYQMYWYRQLPGQAIELIVLSDTINVPNFGNFSDGKYGVAKSVSSEGKFPQ
ncbi:hypothetical protein SKAU_G00331960 [Synaphobranchus kaupii]|uniref:Immunoglobulin V-set domain-containing protein n=1 Tax=Synaphobranchus kaupii TaxID=118154 RepID=A0A9Q1IHM7_SYNKA|nr:hypothetical protein SKAU_G00331960 [Synaphobranchus kaupii]